MSRRREIPDVLLIGSSRQESALFGLHAALGAYGVRAWSMLHLPDVSETAARVMRELRDKAPAAYEAATTSVLRQSVSRRLISGLAVVVNVAPDGLVEPAPHGISYGQYNLTKLADSRGMPVAYANDVPVTEGYSNFPAGSVYRTGDNVGALAVGILNTLPEVAANLAA